MYVHMVLYGVFFFQPVDAFPRPSGPLSASVSPATLKDVNGISDVCIIHTRDYKQVRGRGKVCVRACENRNAKFIQKPFDDFRKKICTSENFPLYGTAMV